MRALNWDSTDFLYKTLLAWQEQNSRYQYKTNVTSSHKLMCTLFLKAFYEIFQQKHMRQFLTKDLYIYINYVICCLYTTIKP
jgi:hypothetical protein